MKAKPAPEPVGEIELAGNISFFDIERAWLELIEARQEAEDLPAERPVCLTCAGRGMVETQANGDAIACAVCEGSGRLQSERELAIRACDEAIGQYITREVEKVDGIRHVYLAAAAAASAAKQERDRQANRMRFAEAVIDRIKTGCQSVMEMAAKKRINGKTGYLLLKGNGGLEPLEVYDAAMVPDNYKLVSVTMPVTLWKSLLRVCRPDVRSRIVPPLAVESISVDNTAVREALKEPCPACGGHPELIVKMKPDDPEGCATCGGSGLSAVPGARLRERGQHVEIK